MLAAKSAAAAVIVLMSLKTLSLRLRPKCRAG
jgi:hypothetical protein